MSDHKRIAKNTIFLYIRMLLLMLVSLYTSRVVLAVLGVEDYGIYNVVGGIVVLFTFINNSMVTSTQRYLNYELGRDDSLQAQRVFSISLNIHVLIALLIFLLSETVGLWLLNTTIKYPESRAFAVQVIYQLSILTTCARIVRAPYHATIIAHERMSFYAYLSIFEAGLQLGVVFLLKAFDFDRLILYGALLCLVTIITNVCYYLYCRKSFVICKYRLYNDKSLYRQLLSFSGWSLFGGVANMGASQGLNMLLNVFFGVTVNAAMGIANQVNGGLQSFVTNITIPVRPQVVQSYSQGNINRSLNLTYTISKLSCYVLLMMSLPIMLEINYVLHIWLGDNVPTYTAIFVVIIVLNSFISNLNSAVSGLVHASGKMKVYQLCGGTISLISVVIVYIAMLIWDIPSAALVVLLVLDIIRQIVALLVLRSIVSEFSLMEYFRGVVIPLIAVALLSMVCPLLTRYLILGGFLRFCIVLIVSVLSVVVSAYVVGLNKNEKNIVGHMLNNLKKKLFKR